MSRPPCFYGGTKNSDAALSIAPPSGYTEIFERTHNRSTLDRFTLEGAYAQQSAAGPTGQATATTDVNATSHAGISVVLRPDLTTQAIPDLVGMITG